MPKVSYCSVFVDDQDKAVRFYVDVLGFAPKHDVPLGEHRWLTLTAPDDPDGTELLPRARRAPRRRPVQGRAGGGRHPVHRVRGPRRRRRGRPGCAGDHGVTVVQDPTPAGPRTIAVVDDTCGNLVQLFSPS